MDPFGNALVASLIAALVTTLGIFVIRRFEAWGRRNSIYFVSFAAGVLIAGPLLHMIPKALEMTAGAAVYVLAGYVLMHLFNRFITAFVCERNPDRALHLGLVPMLGIGFHSLLDGVVYSVTFTVGVFTGVLAAVGMVLHEFPEGIVTYLLLLRGGFAKRTALGLAFLAAALTTPLGVLMANPVVSRIDARVLGRLLGLSAGALVYVGATHLLPQAEREAKRYSLLALAAGIAVAAIVVLTRQH